MRYLLFILRRNGRNTRTVGIIGTNDTTLALVKEISENPETGYVVVGAYDDRQVDRAVHSEQFSLLGNVQQAYADIESGKMETVFVTLSMTANSRIEEILRVLGDTKAQVHLVPNLFVYNLLHSKICNVGELQTVRVFDSSMKGAMNFLKRFEDILLASIILMIIEIPMIFIALAVKITSRGPVIFKQNRYGMDGKKLKFKSLKV